MSRTSLAYIDRHIDGLLLSERNNPTPHQADVVTAAKPRKIAGFHINDPAYSGRQVEDARQKRREIVEKYMVIRADVREMFLDAGVKPKAIIPTTTFTNLCQDAGMYFIPRSGKTGVNPTHFLLWVQGQNIDDVTSNSETEFRGQRLRVKKRDRDAASSRYLSTFPHEEVIRHLLDAEVKDVGLKHSDVGSQDVMVADMGAVRKVSLRAYKASTDGHTYELLLPTPPDDVVERLIKVADAAIETRTVAVYGALDFLDGVAPILHEAIGDLERHEERERARIDWMLHDPIVYYSRGPVTAVIDQFGPFPIEKAMIDRVTAADFLPVNL